MSCGVGHRRGSGPALLWLWLWHRPAATAPIRPLAWESPYARTKDKRQKKNFRPLGKNIYLVNELFFCSFKDVSVGAELMMYLFKVVPNFIIF